MVPTFGRTAKAGGRFPRTGDGCRYSIRHSATAIFWGKFEGWGVFFQLGTYCTDRVPTPISQREFCSLRNYPYLYSHNYTQMKSTIPDYVLKAVTDMNPEQFDIMDSILEQLQYYEEEKQKHLTTLYEWYAKNIDESMLEKDPCVPCVQTTLLRNINHIVTLRNKLKGQ